MNPTLPGPDSIIKHWMEISRLMRQNMSGTKNVSKMNPVQMHALLIIKEHAGLTMKEFAESLHITSPSATSLVNRLVKLKWVKRSADKKNRKLVRLHVSEEGLVIVSTKMKEHTHMMRELFSLLTKADQKTFDRILQNLQKKLAANTKKT